MRGVRGDLLFIQLKGKVGGKRAHGTESRSIVWRMSGQSITFDSEQEQQRHQSLGMSET